VSPQELAARVGRGALTLLGVLAITFALGRLTGDPVAVMLPSSATLADYQAMRASMGLDQPLPEQFIRYLQRVARGDLGVSVVANRPALDLVLERLPATLRLGLLAFATAACVALPLGVAAAVWRSSRFDRTVRDLSLLLQAVPPFVLAILSILLFGVTLQWLPTFGSASLRHYLLPVVTLSVLPLALLLRLMRAALLETLAEEFVRTARAKGAGVRRIIIHHALRNALAPVATVLGLQLAGIISGAVVVETVFAWPGVGSLVVGAINGRDYAIVQTVVLLSATAFVVVNLIVDFLYGWLDPRVRAA